MNVVMIAGLAARISLLAEALEALSAAAERSDVAVREFGAAHVAAIEAPWFAQLRLDRPASPYANPARLARNESKRKERWPRNR